MRRKKGEENGLKKEIIRRQYFRVFLLVLAAVFLTVGIMTLTYSLAHGTFDGSQWAQGMLDGAKVTGVLAIPLVLLSRVKRYRPELPAFVSRDSKWGLTGFVVLMLGICVLLSVL